MNNPVFTESQRFRQPWLILLFVALNGGFLYPVIQQVILGNSIGEQPATNFELVLALLLSLLFTALFFIFRLDTEISDQGISARLFPIHRSFRRFEWKDIQHIEVRQYKPLREYGGWGIRFGRNGKAWNIRGNQGIQLVFGNGKKLLIGTNKPEEVKKALEELKPTLSQSN